VALTVLFCFQEVSALGPSDCNGVKVILLNGVSSEILENIGGSSNTFANNTFTLAGTGKISVRDGTTINTFDSNTIISSG